jgi:hypothetical protein
MKTKTSLKVFELPIQEPKVKYVFSMNHLAELFDKAELLWYRNLGRQQITQVCSVLDIQTNPVG